jgi:hypothetical protein
MADLEAHRLVVQFIRPPNQGLQHQAAHSRARQSSCRNSQARQPPDAPLTPLERIRMVRAEYRRGQRVGAQGILVR